MNPISQPELERIDRQAYEQLRRDHPTLVHLIGQHLKLGESAKQIADAITNANGALYSLIFCAAMHMQRQDATEA
jgi:hypothetical protein